MASGDITSVRGTASDRIGAWFDGVDDYVEIPHNSAQLGANLSNGFTISAWINPRSLGEAGLGTILNKSFSDPSNNGFTCRLNSNFVQIQINGGTSRYSSTLTLNVWTHILITVSSAQIATHYLNNVVSGTPGDLIQAISAITTTNAMRIGNRATATDRTFDGSIKNVKMWNRVLTAAEIASDYAENNISAGQILWVPLVSDYNDKSILGLTGTNSGTILTNTMVNKLTADSKQMNLAAATDKLIVLPVSGRDQTFTIISANRTA